MIKTYTNAGDAADSARGSTLQAMVDARFGAADAARMEYLSARCREMTAANLRCRICGRRINNGSKPRRFPDVCSFFKCKIQARKEAACPAT